METAVKIFEIVNSQWVSRGKWKSLKTELNRLISIEKDINIQLETLESSSSNKKRKNEVVNWLVNVEEVKHDIDKLEAEIRANRWRSKLWGGEVKRLTDEVVALINERSRFQGKLVLEVPVKEPLLETKLVGVAFQHKLEEIWEWLMRDDVLHIGIYGMGGVGKTALVIHIYNRLLENQNTFSNVYWITIPQDFSIQKLQDCIANVIQFDFCSKDVIIRATKLSEALAKKQNPVIILDNLWKQFSPREVGIPERCKLIITTRFSHICQRMDCHRDMKLEPLFVADSRDLFFKELGKTLSLEAERIAQSVVRKLAGLPLAVVTLARSMRGKDDVREWRSVLEQLEQSITRIDDMDDKVFKVLNLSYERLGDSALQECFLYCALFPKDCLIRKEELIEYLISENIIEDLNSRQAQFDKGHSMLKELESACLLQGHRLSFVKVHNLVRDMAINQMKRSPKTMVKAGKQLEEMPKVSAWPEDLVRVSLMENCIKKIPLDHSGHSPSCPNLSTLLLCRNRNLEFIADSFFLEFGGLKVLDLSETAIKELPDSISNLRSLTSLLLRKCQQLLYIPSLATLNTLKKLDLLECMRLEVVPGGLELLSNLQYLDIYGTQIKDIPNGLLPNLCHLQYLRLDWSIAAEVNSECLSKVEYLECCFPKPQHFHSMMMDDHGRPPLSIYRLLIGEFNYDEDSRYKDELGERSKSVVYSGCDIGKDGDFVGFPKELDVLEILRCRTLRSFDKAILADGAEVVIHSCEGLEYLISSSRSSSSNIFDHVITLTLDCLNNLRDLIGREGPSFPPSGVFFCLKSFYMWKCPSITSLFPYELLPNLQNLEEIRVADCEKIEQIFGEESNSGSRTESISLPKLKSLEFRDLPELRSICNKEMAYDSMETFIVRNCPNLRKAMLSYQA